MMFNRSSSSTEASTLVGEGFLEVHTPEQTHDCIAQSDRYADPNPLPYRLPEKDWDLPPTLLHHLPCTQFSKW